MVVGDRQYDELVKTITEEVLAYLEPPAEESVFAVDTVARISVNPVERADVAALIDHTLLKPGASREDIRKLCEEAVKFGFASVCVNPWNVAKSAELVRGSRVRVCSVIGFPLGATLTQMKIYETEQVIKLGALEVDMVQNVGAMKSGMDDVVEQDIRGVVDAAHSAGAICKVILETALLTYEEKVRTLLAAKRAGADFVKTSTGFAAAGATVEDVALMRKTMGEGMGIKASGGVRTLEDVLKMVSAGATRIGTSAGVKIVEEAMKRQ
jgi:deoxyribose-phosphate aldolase